MKISLDWIKDYVKFRISAGNLAERLTMAGLEIEQIYDVQGSKVFDLEVTPNRADCLCMIGMAREIAAVLDAELKLPTFKTPKIPSSKCDVTIKEDLLCQRYIAMRINGLKVKDSPAWVQKKLKRIGLRPVNNIVDITNFSMMESGQPLHAFDFDKLEGGKIEVRKARKGEKLLAIDGNEYTLDSSVLVIADAKRPVAIAGIMGGKNTEVDAETQNILLESAYFNPVHIRRTSRQLALSSDSSYRFERGVVFNDVLTGAQRALSLILDESKGDFMAYTALGKKQQKVSAKAIRISLDQINHYLGAQLTAAQCANIFQKLGFAVKKNAKATFAVSPADFRKDIHQPVDLIEEVARIVGYDNLPATLPSVKPSTIKENPMVQNRKTARDILIRQGFQEVITYAMDSKENLEKTKVNTTSCIKIKNPLSLEQEVMRPSLISNHLQIIGANVNRGNTDLRFFEAGKIYTRSGEYEHLALSMTGSRRQDWRENEQLALDFYDIKGALQSVCGRLKVKDVTFESTDIPWGAKGECANVIKGNTVIGMIAKVDDVILQAWGIKGSSVYFGEINMQAIYAQTLSKTVFQKISNYPPIVHDISLAVGPGVTFQQIKNIVKKNASKLLIDITFKEEYLGEKIDEGKRGLVFSLHFQSNERTLLEDEVNRDFNRVTDALLSGLDVVKR